MVLFRITADREPEGTESIQKVFEVLAEREMRVCGSLGPKEKKVMLDQSCLCGWGFAGREVGGGIRLPLRTSHARPAGRRGSAPAVSIAGDRCPQKNRAGSEVWESCGRCLCASASSGGRLLSSRGGNGERSWFPVSSWPCLGCFAAVPGSSLQPPGRCQRALLQLSWGAGVRLGEFRKSVIPF